MNNTRKIIASCYSITIGCAVFNIIDSALLCNFKAMCAWIVAILYATLAFLEARTSDRLSKEISRIADDVLQATCIDCTYRDTCISEGKDAK